MDKIKLKTKVFVAAALIVALGTSIMCFTMSNVYATLFGLANLIAPGYNAFVLYKDIKDEKKTQIS